MGEFDTALIPLLQRDELRFGPDSKKSLPPTKKHVKHKLTECDIFLIIFFKVN